MLYLTNSRLVFVAKQADAASGVLTAEVTDTKIKGTAELRTGVSAGLVSFELPLAYIRKDKFNQPIFACNNLSGESENGRHLSSVWTSISLVSVQVSVGLLLLGVGHREVCHLMLFRCTSRKVVLAHSCLCTSVL